MTSFSEWGPCLAIDTSTDVISMAVPDADGRVWRYQGSGGAQASQHLLPALADLMSQAGRTGSDLSCIAMGRGPGAFTGLRTACSVVQGLAYGWRNAARPQGVPVLPLDSLLALADEAADQSAAQGGERWTRVIAVLDARMDEVYVAGYEWVTDQWEVRLPNMVCAPGDVAALLQSRWPALYSALCSGDPQAGCAGNAWTAYGPALSSLGGVRRFALPSADALLRLAPAAWREGRAVSAEQALPLYLRDKVAFTTAEREAGLHKVSPLP